MNKGYLYRIFYYLALAWIAVFIWMWIKGDTKTGLLIMTFGFNTLLLTTMLFSAGLVGEKILTFFGHDDDKLINFLLKISIGLSCDMAVLLLLGSVGLIYRIVIVFIIGIPLVLSVRRIKSLLENLPDLSGIIRESSIEDLLLIGCISISFILIMISSFAPEIFYDSLYYHEAFPLLYIIRHKIEVFPHAVHSLMPSYLNVLFIIPLTFSGSEAVKLLHTCFFLLLCMLIYAYGKRFFGRRAGFIGCFFWATIPGACQLAGLGSVDLGVTFFSLFSLFMLVQWIVEKKETRFLVYSAIMLGIAVGSKYSALMVGIACALYILAGCIIRRKETGNKKAIAMFFIFGSISLAVASPWYVRSYLSTDDFLYPVLSSKNTSGYYAYQNLKKDSQKINSLKEIFYDLPVKLWKQSPRFGAGSLLGIGVFAFIPAILWGLFGKGSSRWLGFSAIILYILWSNTILIVRYLYPALAICSLIAGGMMSSEKIGKIQKYIIYLFIFVTAFYNAQAISNFYINRMGDVFNYISSSQSPQQYLNKYTAEGKAAAFVRRELPVDAKLLLIGETQGFYFYRNYMPVSSYDIHPVVAWIGQCQDYVCLNNILKQNGFTYLVLNKKAWKRIRDDYGNMILDEREENILMQLIKSLKPVYLDENEEIYEL